MKKALTIIKFEYLGYISGKVFKVVSTVLLIVIAILALLPQIRIMATRFLPDDNKAKAALIASPELLTPEALNSLGLNYEWVFEHGDGAEIVSKGIYKIALDYTGGNSYILYVNDYDFRVFHAREALDVYLTDFNRALLIDSMPEDSAVLAKQAIDSLVRGELRTVGGGSANSNYAIAYAIMMLMYLSVTLFGTMVTNSIIGEKTSKAMEVMITSANPTQLMFGKVIGVGFAGLTQILIILFASFLGFSLNYDNWVDQFPTMALIIRSSNLTLELSILFILFYITGYFIFSFINAGFASTVSRLEDSNSVALPSLILVMTSFAFSMFNLQSVDTPIVKVMSYIPPFSAFVMSSRLCMGDATIWEGFLSLGLLVMGAIVIGMGAARIYKVGVTMYGKPPKFGEIMKLIFAKD
ncbi:MAG: ABC transporter permease [Clostridiales bacterium]|jgi:ABC-2 type transport system permease protein|nr:ABC transporter permease [Clostridiales bacterium]